MSSHSKLFGCQYIGNGVSSISCKGSGTLREDTGKCQLLEGVTPSVLRWCHVGVGVGV